MKIELPLNNNLGRDIQRLNASINKYWFMVNEILKASVSSKPKINILFSRKPAWEKNIRIGFQTTKHRLSFKEFTRENILANDLVVPLTMDDIRYLNENRHLIPGSLIPIPNNEAIKICDDKYLFYQTLLKKGFGQYLPSVNDNLPFPYILKKKVAEDSDACYIIADENKQAEFKSLIGNPDYFCQEIVKGAKEYATHVLFKKGKIVSSLNIEYVFQNETPIKGKDAITYKRVRKCTYLETFAQILLSIGFEGLCCLNYKIIDDQPFIFEINPRFGGSLGPFFFSFIRNIN